MEAIGSLDAALGHIHHQDCIAGMNALPAGSVDLVFADPPFNIGYEYDVYHDSKDYGQYLAWSREWIAAVHRVLKPDGTFWLAIGDEYAAELKLLAQRDVGFHIRSWVIWYYTFGVNCTTKFSRSHAHLFHFVKHPKKFTFRAKELENRVPSARQLVYGDSRANPDGRLPDDTWILRPQDLAGHFTPDEDTWYFPRVAGTFKERKGFHGCQMPEQLLGRIIRSCSHERDIVLDPFSGSATTLAVAKKLARQWVGFDLSSEYVKRGTARLAETHAGDALDGAPEPTMSAPATPKQRNKKSQEDMSPIEQIMDLSAQARVEKSKGVFERGVVEAFRRVCDGFSADRVVADPALNTAFIDSCRHTGIVGDARSWNYALLRLRKAGRLAEFATEHRTEFSWQECDSYLFASEIAWKQLLDDGYASLDDILCDPEGAARFDSIARSLAPDFTSLMYRWGALKLRKASKRARSQASLLAKARLSPRQQISSRALAQVPDQAGVYLVHNQNQRHPLYAGGSLNLRSRLTRQFDAVRTRTWKKNWGQPLAISFFVSEPQAPLLLAYQSLYVQIHHPRLNIPELAVA